MLVNLSNIYTLLVLEHKSKRTYQIIYICINISSHTLIVNMLYFIIIHLFRFMLLLVLEHSKDIVLNFITQKNNPIINYHNGAVPFMMHDMVLSYIHAVSFFYHNLQQSAIYYQYTVRSTPDNSFP